MSKEQIFNSINWINEKTTYSMTKLLKNNCITNAVDSETSGIFICSSKYLKENTNNIVGELGIIIPNEEFEYMKFFVDEFKLDKSSPFVFFKDIIETQEFLMVYYNEFSDNFYHTNRHTKVLE